MYTQWARYGWSALLAKKVKPSKADAIRWIFTNPLVRCIHLYSFIPSRQGDLIKIHLLAVQTTKTDMYLTGLDGKYTPLSLSSTWALASNICLTDMPLLVYVISFLYNVAVLAREDVKSPSSDFFFWLNFAICKGWQIKTTVAYTWPVSSLVYKTISNGIHWVGTRWLWCQLHPNMAWAIANLIDSKCSNSRWMNLLNLGSICANF